MWPADGMTVIMGQAAGIGELGARRFGADVAQVVLAVTPISGEDHE
jgi:hypothetical protein